MENSAHTLTLTVEQAAKLLGIGRSTAYELVHTGDIPSLRLGRRIVVPIGRLAERLGIDPEGLRTQPSGAGAVQAMSRSWDVNREVGGDDVGQRSRTLF